ncbi:MAG: hypothetical protein ABL897_05725 [Hyphomicrobium sp.]
MTGDDGFASNEPPCVDRTRAFSQHYRFNPLALELEAIVFPFDRGALDINGGETGQDIQQEKSAIYQLALIVDSLGNGQKFMHAGLQPRDNIDEAIRYDVGTVVSSHRKISHKPVFAWLYDNPLWDRDAERSGNTHGMPKVTFDTPTIPRRSIRCDPIDSGLIWISTLKSIAEVVTVVARRKYHVGHWVTSAPLSGLVDA